MIVPLPNGWTVVGDCPGVGMITLLPDGWTVWTVVGDCPGAVMIKLFPDGWTVVGRCAGVIVVALPVSGWMVGDCARDALTTESMIRTAQAMARIVFVMASSSLENGVAHRYLRFRTWAETLSRNVLILGKT
jgi:hypothetical protein